MVRGAIFEMRCGGGPEWIQKNLISPSRRQLRATTAAMGELLRQIQNPQFGWRKCWLAVRATDRPDRAARDENRSRLTRKRYSHFFRRGQNSCTFAFKSWQR